MKEKIEPAAAESLKREEISKVLPEAALESNGDIIEGSEIPLDKLGAKMYELSRVMKDSVWSRDKGQKYEKLTKAQAEALKTMHSRLEGILNDMEMDELKRKKRRVGVSETEKWGHAIIDVVCSLDDMDIKARQKQLRNALIYLGSIDDARFALDEIDVKNEDEHLVITRFMFNHPELKSEVIGKFATEKRKGDDLWTDYLTLLLNKIRMGSAAVEEYHNCIKSLRDIREMIKDGDGFAKDLFHAAVKSGEFKKRLSDADKKLVEEILAESPKS